jgi:hypothetical protein
MFSDDFGEGKLATKFSSSSTFYHDQTLTSQTKGENIFFAICANWLITFFFVLSFVAKYWGEKNCLIIILYRSHMS